MTTQLDEIRTDDGQLPKFAWPGGYPLYYLTKDGEEICPDCANREVDESQAVIDYGCNWEDASLFCGDCGERIESAYAEG